MFVSLRRAGYSGHPILAVKAISAKWRENLPI
jgi:hypothetical protein